MSSIIFQMKTHSREDITEQFPDLNNCIIHNIKPRILKIVAGKRKEVHYVAHCKHDDCGKISFDVNDTVNAWNKWNPKQSLSQLK